jgi:hypothetical protein
MKRRSSIITFNESGSVTSSNCQQQSITDSRKASSESIQSNTSNNSQKNNSNAANFLYQPPQLIRYPTV